MADFLKTRVSTLDDLIVKKGIERANTILLSGGCGTGKTVFTMQMLCKGALAGERGIYISLVEEPDKIKRHMKSNFGWDIDAFEAKGQLFVQKVDLAALVEDVTTMVDNQRKMSAADITLFNEEKQEISLVDSRKIKLPFKPDRIVIDSISSLEAAFTNKDHYRMYLQAMIEALNQHNSVNFLLAETEQEPDKYSKSGAAEFLVDGVFVLYNLRKGSLRRRAIEILKLRCSDHAKELIPYMITAEGITLISSEKVF
jgi:KaiC/GvpD/RAD55 family RecA-like ATPase